MSCIILDLELVDKNVIKVLGVFVDGRVQRYSFRPPKKYNPTKQSFWCTRNIDRIVWNSRRLDYSELPNILPRDAENSRILASLMDKGWKILMIRAVPKFKISLMKKCGFARVTHSDTRRHFTVQSAMENCLVFG